MIEAMTMAKFSSCRYFVLFFTSPSKKKQNKTKRKRKKKQQKKKTEGLGSPRIGYNRAIRTELRETHRDILTDF